MISRQKFNDQVQKARERLEDVFCMGERISKEGLELSDQNSILKSRNAKLLATLKTVYEMSAYHRRKLNACSQIHSVADKAIREAKDGS